MNSPKLNINWCGKFIFSPLCLLLVLNLKIEKLFIESDACEWVLHVILKREESAWTKRWQNKMEKIDISSSPFIKIDFGHLKLNMSVVKVCFVRLWNANNACLHYLNQYFFFAFFRSFFAWLQLVLFWLCFAVEYTFCMPKLTPVLAHTHSQTVCDSHWYWSSIVVKYWHSYITNFCQRINFKQI